MAEYKRKKVKKRKVSEPTVSKSGHSIPKEENIKMRSTAPKRNKPLKAAEPKSKKTSPSKNKVSSSKFKVHQGFKKKHTVKSRIIGIISLLLITVIFITALCVPVNIFEATGNMFASIGSTSKYPVSLSGGITLDVKTNGRLIYILSDTNVDVFNTSGKLITSVQHGYENPALKVSSGRSLIYDIGSKGYTVFNPMGVVNTNETKKEIICANISRSGAIALATKSDTHASEVQVISKSGSLVYTWYCSSGTITNVALSASGKSLAACVLTTDNGAFKSKVNVMTYKSATPVASQDYDGLIYSLETVSATKFCVTTERASNYCFFKAKAPVSVNYDYPVSSAHIEYADFVAINSRRAGDKSENNIYLFNKSGKQTAKTVYEGTLTDFHTDGKYIYCLGNSEVIKLSKKGEIVSRADCGFSALKVVGAGKSALVITDNSLYRVNF